MLIPLALPGFALAAIAYLGFALLLGIKGAPSGTGRLFLVAVAIEAVWAATVAAAMAGLPVPVLLVSLAEAARLFFWILFLLSLLRAMGAGDASAPDSAQRAASGGMVAAATIAAGAVAVELFAFGERPAFIVHVIGAVFALVCLEQVYRNTGPDGRWALKFLAIGLLALFGFDLFMYSEALLFSRMNPALWSVRGYANALLVPLLGIAAARNDQWKTGITVSRQVVFHSATLFAAGLFLMLMAVGGYLLRWFGGDWGEAAQALFVFIAVVALMVALFSGSLRARLRCCWPLLPLPLRLPGGSGCGSWNCCQAPAAPCARQTVPAPSRPASQRIRSAAPSQTTPPQPRAASCSRSAPCRAWRGSSRAPAPRSGSPATTAPTSATRAGCSTPRRPWCLARTRWPPSCAPPSGWSACPNGTSIRSATRGLPCPPRSPPSSRTG
jgi:hypothetical protein